MATIKQEVAAVLAAAGKTDVHPLVIEKLEELAFVMWEKSINRRLLVSRNQREGLYAGRKPWFWGVKRTRTKEVGFSLKRFNSDTAPLLEGTHHERKHP